MPFGALGPTLPFGEFRAVVRSARCRPCALHIPNFRLLSDPGPLSRSTRFERLELPRVRKLNGAICNTILREQLANTSVIDRTTGNIGAHHDRFSSFSRVG
jgi:hypothetical protein